MSAPERSSDATATRSGWFNTTHWTVVLDACGDDAAQATPALAQLCQTYWQPLYAYVRRSGHSPQDAEDLTQAFFARLLEKDYLKALRPERGKFRSFLLTVFKRFLAGERERANRQKRGGGCKIISLDCQAAEARYLAEPMDQNTPEKVFDHSWAIALLEQVISRLKLEMVAEGKAELMAELKGFLSGDDDLSSYPETARRLGMTEGTLRVNIHRLRHRYRDLLRAEIAHTVDTPEGIDDEIRRLFAALS